MDSPAVLAAGYRVTGATPRRPTRCRACHWASSVASSVASRLALYLALGGALALGWSAAVHAEWLFDVDAGARYESNLTRAQQDPDIRADAAATLLASGGYFFALTGADGLTLDVNAAGEAWNRFHGLNEISIGGSAS